MVKRAALVVIDGWGERKEEAGASYVARRTLESVKLHTLLLFDGGAYFVFFCFSIIICLTIFCSSIRNARTTRCRTHFAHREPP